MITRPVEPAEIATASTSLIPASSLQKKISMANIKTHRVIFFDADIGTQDLEPTLAALNRLKDAGYQLVGYSSVIPVEQSQYIGNSEVAITVRTDIHITHSVVHSSISKMAIPLVACHLTDNMKLNDVFNEIFSNTVGYAYNKEEWRSVEGYWVGRQKSFGEKVKNDSHIIKFSTLLGETNFGDETRGRSVGAGDTTSRGVKIRLNQTDELIVGKNKFTVNMNYAGKRYEKLSSALEKIDSSWLKSLGSVLGLTNSTAETKTAQLSLLAGEEKKPENKFSAELSTPATQPKFKRRLFFFLFALIATIVISTTSFILFPAMLAIGITAATGVITFTSAMVLDKKYNTTDSNYLNQIPDSTSPIIEEVDEEVSADNTKRASNRKILQQLRRARHDTTEQKKDSAEREFVEPTHSHPDNIFEDKWDNDIDGSNPALPRSHHLPF